MKRLLFGVATLVTLAAVLVPSTVLASGMSIAVGSPLKLVNRVYVAVPLTIVCDDLSSFGIPLQSGVFVNLSQAAGQTLVTGFGQSVAFGSSFLTCDGTTQNQITIDVFPGNGVFHGGPAVLQANAFYGVGQCFFTNPDGSCGSFTITASEQASIGPLSVNFSG
jgi:hypothetical protein